MLKDSNIIAVLAAKDINRAKEFYRDKLGIEPSDSMEEGSLMYSCGQGTGFLVYQTENAGTAKNTPDGLGNRQSRTGDGGTAGPRRRL